MKYACMEVGNNIPHKTISYRIGIIIEPRPGRLQRSPTPADGLQAQNPDEMLERRENQMPAPGAQDGAVAMRHIQQTSHALQVFGGQHDGTGSGGR